MEGHAEVAKLRTELGQVDAILDWAAANPEGGTLPDGKGGEVEFTAAQVRQMERKADRSRQELVSSLAQTRTQVKAAHDQVYQQVHTQAVKLYPWVAQKESPAYQRMQQMFTALPSLKAFPDRELIVARYERGRVAEEAELRAKKVAPKTAPRDPAKVVTTAGAQTAARRAAGAGNDGQEVTRAQKQFEKSGRVEDLARSFAAGRRAVAR